MTHAGNIGLIGLGLIGTALARRLIGAKFPVIGYDIDRTKAARLHDLGGRAANSVAELVCACERIVIAVFDTDQVEDVIRLGNLLRRMLSDGRSTNQGPPGQGARALWTRKKRDVAGLASAVSAPISNSATSATT